ncbi:MAG: hypothetical protein J2P50_16515 [Hyphomicrobiaceae bacterium]|nr:hypothetical protein [Hyphomicrobiaceae bacterium]
MVTAVPVCFGPLLFADPMALAFFSPRTQPALLGATLLGERLGWLISVALAAGFRAC